MSTEVRADLCLSQDSHSAGSSASKPPHFSLGPVSASLEVMSAVLYHRLGLLLPSWGWAGSS